MHALTWAYFVGLSKTLADASCKHALVKAAPGLKQSVCKLREGSLISVAVTAAPVDGSPVLNICIPLFHPKT